MTEEMKSKYFAGTAIALRREGFQVEELQNGHLNVLMDDKPLCEVNKIGGITYRDVSTPERIAAKDRAFGIVNTTAEYIRGMELAPPLGVKDLKDRYKVLADFNGTVLTCSQSEFGVDFVTWVWNINRNGVSGGHYFGGDYKAAKQDFATRSGLIPEQRIFSDEQLIEIYQCCSDTLVADYDMLYDQVKCITSVQEQIEYIIPDIIDRIEQQNQNITGFFPRGPTM